MKCKLWYVNQETDKARRYCRLPKSRNPEHKDYVWVPLSVIEGSTRQPAEPDEWPVHYVTVADWFGQRENL